MTGVSGHQRERANGTIRTRTIHPRLPEHEFLRAIVRWARFPGAHRVHVIEAIITRMAGYNASGSYALSAAIAVLAHQTRPRAQKRAQFCQQNADDTIHRACRLSRVRKTVQEGSYMAECHAFSQELLFVLWWCRLDGFRQLFIIGSRFSRKDCNYFKYLNTWVCMLYNCHILGGYIPQCHARNG